MSQNIEVSARYTETGNLLQLEYAKKASAKGNTVIGINFRDGVLLAVEKQIASKTLDTSSLQSISGISKVYAMTYSGLAHDNNVVVYLMRDFARSVQEQTEKEPADEMFLDNLRQYLIYFSSYMSYRPVGCEFLVSSGKGGNFSLFYVDPSGYTCKCYSYSIGCNSQAAKTELEKIDFSKMSQEDAIQSAVRVFFMSRSPLVEGPFQIEMMCVSKETCEQTRIPEEEIEKHVSEFSNISIQ